MSLIANTKHRTFNQVVGVRAKFMASQMVTFMSSMALPEPGQIFTVESMTWVIDLDDNWEIVEAV
jgi:hypothetical protein